MVTTPITPTPIRPGAIRGSFTVVAQLAAIIAAIAGCLAVYLEYAGHGPTIDVFAHIHATSRIENDKMTPYLRLFVSVLNRTEREIAFDWGTATFHRNEQEITYRLFENNFSSDYKVAPRQRLNFEMTITPEVLLPERANGEINLRDTLDNRFSGPVAFATSIETDWKQVAEASERFNASFPTVRTAEAPKQMRSRAFSRKVFVGDAAKNRGRAPAAESAG
jgi:hypothetical protein